MKEEGVWRKVALARFLFGSLGVGAKSFEMSIVHCFIFFAESHNFHHFAYNILFSIRLGALVPEKHIRAARGRSQMAQSNMCPDPQSNLLLT